MKNINKKREPFWLFLWPYNLVCTLFVFSTGILLAAGMNTSSGSTAASVPTSSSERSSEQSNIPAPITTLPVIVSISNSLLCKEGTTVLECKQDLIAAGYGGHTFGEAWTICWKDGKCSNPNSFVFQTETIEDIETEDVKTNEEEVPQ